MPAPVIPPDGIHFYVKTDKQDFIDAVKTRGETLEPAEVGHRVTSLGHLGQIAIQVGGKAEMGPRKGAVPRQRQGQRHDRPADPLAEGIGRGRLRPN